MGSPAIGRARSERCRCERSWITPWTCGHFVAYPGNTNFIEKTAITCLRRQWRRHALMIRDVDSRPQLPSIRQPVLMLCGKWDRIVTAACEKPLLELLPKVARFELPCCGHYPHYTHAPLVAEIVRQFFEAPACRLGQ